MNDQTTVPPPLQSPPTAKERKYDRQLRLWAASGQAALEDAHVLLLNSGTGVVGVEALKNLVLPNIGQFTIQDSAQVTEADLGVNFFLEDQDLGKLRVDCTRNWLVELNPDVHGQCIAEVGVALKSCLTRKLIALYSLWRPSSPGPTRLHPSPSF